VTDKAKGGPPRWVFTILMVGGFVACGIYLGMMRVEGATTGNTIRALGFGVFGLVALWGVLTSHWRARS
jgi:hypothetical protein